MISLSHALREMRKKDDRGRFVPFSMDFVSKETGEIVKYKDVTLPQRERVELDTLQRSEDFERKYKPTITFKKGEDIRQCYIHLITRLNGEKVI